MKNTFKRFVAGASLAAMLSAGAVFATEEMPAVTEMPTADEHSVEKEAKAPVQPFVTTFETIDGVTMLPVRAIAEHFGYNVEWIEESQSVALTKGAVYILFSINENSYAFSKMAPQQLEMAPVLVNEETTYVPLSLFTSYLNLNAHIAENQVEIVEPRIVSVISMDAENNQISVMDEFYGEVIVNIDPENTKVTIDGAEVMDFILGEGQLLAVEYANYMTASIPAQTTAISIEILNTVVEEEPVLDGSKIVAIENELVTVTDETYGELVLVVGDETEITVDGEKAELKDLAVGYTVKYEHSEAMTRSLPPQTVAIKIEAVK